MSNGLSLNFKLSNNTLSNTNNKNSNEANTKNVKFKRTSKIKKNCIKNTNFNNKQNCFFLLFFSKYKQQLSSQRTTEYLTTYRLNAPYKTDFNVLFDFLSFLV